MGKVLAADVDRIAAGVSPPDGCALVAAFRAQSSGEDDDDPWRLLANVFDIHLRPGNPNEPFGPMLVMDGKRSMVPSDLDDAAVGWLREVLAGVTVPAVRARIGDVLWVARREGRAGRHAVSAYIAQGVAVEDADMWPPCMECYERAVRLARSLGRNDPLLAMALQQLADRVEHYRGEDPSFLTGRALELLDEFRFGDPARLSRHALTAARARDGAAEPYAARTYFDIAARFLARAGLEDEADQARTDSARTWVTEADQAEAAGGHGAAQSHLENAIQAYRAIPGCKELLPPLHRRLDAAGAAALKSMRPVSKSIEIGPLVAAARKSVQGLPLAEAIYALACACPTLEPGSLREQVLKAAKQSPLSSMFGVVIYDRNGRVVHKHPGLHTADPEEREQALEALMCRNADLVRGLTVHAQLVPALMGLLGEHVVEEADMLMLLEGSILIPGDRAGLFAMGLVAGFRRDMVSAMHLLVPQLEHALRLLLKQAGVITASIDSDGIQSDWPLGRLLATGEMRDVLPETLIFELRSLLVHKGGSNIRNRLCHGLLAPEDFATSSVLYLWWLLLKVALHGTPGFQAWIDERVREAESHPTTSADTPPNT